MIAEQVQEAMLERRSTLNTVQTKKNAEPVRRMLKFERDLAKQIKAVMEQYRETQKELRLSPDNIHKVVELALELAGQLHLIPAIVAHARLTELRRAIEEELDQPEVVQLTLFDDPERDQFERNKLALQSRLKEIPGEVERETDAVTARYADPQPRMFPVAVTFLIPEKFA